MCLTNKIAPLLFAGMLSAPSVLLAAQRPNIVFIMADDQAPQAISCYDGSTPLVQTPNIDRLAETGVRFTDAFANDSICSPSRAVLLTGKYNHICGVEKLDGHFNGDQETFPKLLQHAGYQTAIVGKWHLWSQPTGFNYYCVLPGFGSSFNSKFKETGHPWENGYQGGIVHKGYFTDVITDISLDWLKHRRDPGKPFCIMIHHRAPHAPHDAAPKDRGLFQNKDYPEPPTLLDNYQGRAPEPVANQLEWSRLFQLPRGYLRNDAAVRKQLTGNWMHDTRYLYQVYMREYLRMVVSLDRNVGRVLDYLNTSGLATNTIVIYMSDNGFFLGEHGFYNKMWMYEDGFHIPLIVHMPNCHTATTNNQIVSMLDVAPTILDLAGVKIPSDIQGCSMKPLIMGKPTPWRDSLYYHYYGYGRSRAKNWIASPDGEIFGVRTRTAKLICYPRWKGGPFWEMFNLKNDPLEMTNLYHKIGDQQEVASLKQKLRELAVKYKDSKTVKLLDTLGSDSQAKY